MALTYPPPKRFDGGCAAYQEQQLLPALRSAGAAVGAVTAASLNVTAMKSSEFNISSYGRVIG